jgi:hypothetical protein
MIDTKGDSRAWYKSGTLMKNGIGWHRKLVWRAMGDPKRVLGWGIPC